MKLAALLICAVSVSAAAEGIDTRVDFRLRKELLTRVASELESRYVVPETAAKLAALVRARLKANAYGKITSKLELAKALTDDLFTVAHDKHLAVFVSFTPLPTEPSNAPRTPTPGELEQVRRDNGDITKVEILDGNVGYLRANGAPWVDGARPAIAAAFAFVHNTNALIIDHRQHRGGDPNTASLYSSYLSEGEPYLTCRFLYREGNRVQEFWTTNLGNHSYGASKPVYVLTSSYTFSAGEAIAYDLKARKRAVIVGEVTAGGATSPVRFSLGHQFGLALPIARGEHPITKTTWEGVGVQPDVSVNASTALSKAHTLAIERLRADTSSERARSEFDSVLMKLQAVDDAASGKALRLPNAALLGAYVPVYGSGTTVVISESDGRLIWHVDGTTDRALILVGGNRYQREGMPSGYTISFRAGADQMELLMEDPIRPSVIRAKR